MTSWGDQFSQGDHGSKQETFWRNGFRKCPSCDKSNIEKDSIPAGCRHNGDAYGTDTFKCNDCGWNTSFQWDDASDCFYYATKFWDREPPKPIPRRELDSEMIAKFKRISKLVDTYSLKVAMISDGISKEDILTFIEDLEAEKPKEVIETEKKVGKSNSF